MKTVINREQPLIAEVKNGLLTISIGVSTLAFAAQAGEDWEDSIEGTITDETGFAKDVANELLNEDEIGASLVTAIIDKACVRAAEQGSIHMTGSGESA